MQLSGCGRVFLRHSVGENGCKHHTNTSVTCLCETTSFHVTLRLSEYCPRAVIHNICRIRRRDSITETGSLKHDRFRDIEGQPLEMQLDWMLITAVRRSDEKERNPSFTQRMEICGTPALDILASGSGTRSGRCSHLYCIACTVWVSWPETIGAWPETTLKDIR